MMNGQQITEAVLEWARETVPELLGGYDHIPTLSDEPLPDVVVEVENVSVMETTDLFPEAAIQQAWIKLYRLGCSFLVDNTDHAAAAQSLREFEAALSASLLADGTLGGRVPFTSKRVEYDFTPPFIERPDGTRGREMTMTMYVGELVEEE